MSEPFLAEIKMVGFNFAPRGWAFCDGQILPINQNQSLFSLLGTTYGGDGRTTFALPDLRGRSVMHPGPGFTQGQNGGEASHTLSLNEIPAHRHSFSAVDAAGNLPIPSGANLARANNLYAEGPAGGQVHSGTIANVGGGQAHANRPPYLAIGFCIALTGLFPSRN